VFRDLLLRRVSSFCQLTTSQVDQLQQHYELMLRWNKTINLTRIEDEQEVVDRHYAESLFLGSNLPDGPLHIADLGSGAGFPGIPIAILRPEYSVTLIESHQRKAVFLKEASRELGNVRVASKRAEDVGDTFDWVVSRAVSWDAVKKVGFVLAPKLALFGTDAPTPNCEAIPIPWSPGSNIIHVSRETFTTCST
jgi:16S rRNA (guanine(527)-N(7))-methyltransferase RsmG